MFGSGANWRTLARRLTAGRPDWGLALVDLRMHGGSLAAPPPHTVATAAADLVRLDAALAGQGHSVRGVIGHSFGGKVALLYAGQRAGAVQRVWILDSDPAAHPGALMRPEPGSTVAVLELLERLPRQFASRDAFVAAVVAAGFQPGLAQWLGMNIVHDDGAYCQRLDPAAMRSLLTSYYETDAWPQAEAVGAKFVLGGASSAVSAESRARMRRPHVLPDAGHWLHVDALAALVDIIASAP
jgi:esterase